MSEEKTYPWWVAAVMMADGKFMKVKGGNQIHRINLETRRLEYWSQCDSFWNNSNCGNYEQPADWVVCDGPKPKHEYVPCTWAEAYALRECPHNFNESEHYTYPAIKCDGTGWSINWVGSTLFREHRFEMRKDLYDKFFAKK